MPTFSTVAKSHHRILLALLGVLVVTAGGWWARTAWDRPDPRLETPQVALATLRAKSLYYNEPAHQWLRSQRPDLLMPEEQSENSERARSLAMAVQNPKLFRQLDRRWRFDTLLLTGDPTRFKPLLEHLMETKDWTLRYADHTSLVFRRDAEPAWTLANFDAVRGQFSNAPAKDRVEVLVQTATRLIAAKESTAAKQLLEEAEKLTPRDARVANGMATYHLARGDWREASAAVERALAEDDDFFPALATKTQLLYGAKRFGEAYEISKKLIERVPDDPGLLFYHAKIAHEAHAYKAEIAVLEKLIPMASAQGMALGGYYLYLGQAYAAVGDAPRSIDSFMQALNDPDLPEDQRAFARENIARIKKRTGQ